MRMLDLSIRGLRSGDSFTDLPMSRILLLNWCRPACGRRAGFHRCLLESTWFSWLIAQPLPLSGTAGGKGDRVAAGNLGDSTFWDALVFLAIAELFRWASIRRQASHIARRDPPRAAVRQEELQPSTFFGGIDHARSGAVGDALEIILIIGFLVERDAGLLRGVEFHLVADYCRSTTGAAEDRK
jgi:hypothetical protein